MTADFALDPQDSAPLYAQLYRDLRQRILDGAYAEGHPMASVYGAGPEYSGQRRRWKTA